MERGGQVEPFYIKFSERCLCSHHKITQRKKQSEICLIFDELNMDLESYPHEKNPYLDTNVVKFRFINNWKSANLSIKNSGNSLVLCASDNTVK